MKVWVRGGYSDTEERNPSKTYVVDRTIYLFDRFARTVS
jgi:hypothetical protein